MSPFYTPNASFYRVDTALVVPQLTTANWQLRIHGMVDKAISINFDDLMKRPQIQRDITIVCVSESVGGGYIGNARWQGARLADLLREAGVHPGATQIVMRDTQGMAIGVSTQAVMDGRDAMLAVAMNGQPLPPEHGFPVRVVVPGLYGYVSACKWVVDMEVTTYAAYNAYWVKRGWSEQAEVKTESRIDTPKPGKALTAGPVVVAGVAWAQRKGVARVEVGVDGVWQRGHTGHAGHDRHLAAVVLPLERHPGRAQDPGPGDRSDRLHADRGRARAAAQRRHRVPHHRAERGLRSLTAVRRSWRAP